MIGGIVLGFVLANLLLNALTLWALFATRGEADLDRRLRKLEWRIADLEGYVDEIAEHPALSVPPLPPRDAVAALEGGAEP